jgi:phospholipid/cholesterol/gamma-HCH transport system ATP-binding protein
VPTLIAATPGMPERKAAKRRQDRVRDNLHLLPKDVQEAILASFGNDGQEWRRDYDDHARHRVEADTVSISTSSRAELRRSPR